jgi:hypothetical protein
VTPSRRKNDAKGAVVTDLSPGTTTLAERVSPTTPPEGLGHQAAPPWSAQTEIEQRISPEAHYGLCLRLDPGEHPAPNKLHAESTLAEHMRKGNRQTKQDLAGSDRVRRIPPSRRQAGASPAKRHRLDPPPPRKEAPPPAHPVAAGPPQQLHRRAPSDARAAAQAGESSEHGVFQSLPRMHHRAEETSSELRSAGAAARRHQPPEGLCPATFAGGGGGKEGGGGRWRWQLGFLPESLLRSDTGAGRFQQQKSRSLIIDMTPMRGDAMGFSLDYCSSCTQLEYIQAETCP